MASDVRSVSVEHLQASGILWIPVFGLHTLVPLSTVPVLVGIDPGVALGEMEDPYHVGLPHPSFRLG